MHYVHLSFVNMCDMNNAFPTIWSTELDLISISISCAKFEIGNFSYQDVPPLFLPWLKIPLLALLKIKKETMQVKSKLKNNENPSFSDYTQISYLCTLRHSNYLLMVIVKNLSLP